MQARAVVLAPPCCVVISSVSCRARSILATKLALLASAPHAEAVPSLAQTKSHFAVSHYFLGEFSKPKRIADISSYHGGFLTLFYAGMMTTIPAERHFTSRQRAPAFTAAPARASYLIARTDVPCDWPSHYRSSGRLAR